MEPIKIYIAHPNEQTLRTLVSIVEGLDHEVVGSSNSAREMVAECKNVCTELIISGVNYPDYSGIEALIEIARHEPKPAVIIAQNDDLEDVERAMDDHVMAYLVDPVSSDDLRPTIYVVKRRFEQFQDLKKENESLRDAMEVRKVVERAKGILMRRHSLDEEQAYLKLQSMATSKRIKMRDIAEIVIEMERGPSAG